MTTISTVLDEFRTDLGIDIGQLPNPNAIRYYNDGRDILIDRIMKEKESFFYNEITFSLINGQREYSMPKRGDLAEDGVTVMDGLAKIQAIGVRNDPTLSFTKIEPKALSNLDDDLLSYSTTISPFYIVSDVSFFLYPTPTSDVEEGGIVYGIFYPKKLTTSNTDTIFDSYTKVMLYYVAERYYASQHQWNESQMYSTKFKEEVNRIAISLSGRNESPKQITTPSLRKYC